MSSISSKDNNNSSLLMLQAQNTESNLDYIAREYLISVDCILYKTYTPPHYKQSLVMQTPQTVQNQNRFSALSTVQLFYSIR